MIRPPDMDDAHPMENAASDGALLERLKARALVLAGLSGLIAGFVLFGGLRAEIGALGLAAAMVTAIIWPRRAEHTVPVAGPMVDAAAVPMREAGTLQAFAEALGDPCMVLDRRGVVVYRNAAAARQFPNVQPERVLTLALRNPELIAAIDGTMRSGDARSFELHETVPSETWDRVVVAPLRRTEEDWLGNEGRQLLVTFQSLTELKRVDAMRADFIANASHELRTPLASLVGFIDTLLGPAARDEAARAKFLGIMQAQADRMSRLIDDMLSLSRIEMHQHVRPTGTVDLAALLREVREGLQTQAGAAGVEVVLSVPGTVVNVTGDRGQLYEVFENLMDNAIKYGASGKRIEVTLSDVDRLGMRHMVSVVDHGPGVEPEHVPRMTERFYRIDAEASRKKKGTGLGLAIVKHIVQRHRGQISIKSAPGEGVRVDVLLP